jgi:hypothetical protein
MLAEKVLPEHAALFRAAVNRLTIDVSGEAFSFRFQWERGSTIETAIHAPAVENKSKLRK